MKIQTKTIPQFFERGIVQMRRHIYALLLLLFIGLMALAGFVFWQFGYVVSLQEPEIAVRSVVPKENELRALIEKARERDSSRDTIFEKAIHDPFIKPEKTL